VLLRVSMCYYVFLPDLIMLYYVLLSVIRC